MDIHRLLNPDDNVCASRAQETTLLRAGKWTEEEELFAAAMVKHFVAGSLSLPTGSSLRNFLARTLRCSLARISDKLTAGSLAAMTIPKRLGQQRFFPSDLLSHSHRIQVASELLELEQAFLRRECLGNESMLPSVAVPSTPTSSETDSDDEPTRIGSWSREEQVYARALIDSFLNGLVDISSGTSMRSFLADRLSCSPMRISKKLARGKLAGTVLPKRLGSATFKAAPGCDDRAIDRTEQELERLRRNCFAPCPNSVDAKRRSTAATPTRVIESGRSFPYNRPTQRDSAYISATYYAADAQEEEVICHKFSRYSHDELWNSRYRYAPY